MTNRRAVLRVGAAAALAGRLPARAAAWPDKPIRMIWPFAAAASAPRWHGSWPTV